MAVDKLVDSSKLNAALDYEASKIIAKGGGTAPLAFDFANEKGFGDYIDAIPSGGGGPQWELIGTKTIALQEYTSTTTAEETDTQIDISNTDYAWFLTVITCDTAITTTSEWGMTIGFGGRYTSNGAYYNYGAGGQKGSATLSKSAMVTPSLNWSAYGVWVLNNKSSIQISRKCHATVCPKCRAGNYTVKVYGLKSL